MAARKKPVAAPPPPEEKTQAERFIEAARQAGASEKAAEFDRAFAKVVKRTGVVTDGTRSRCEPDT